MPFPAGDWETDVAVVGGGPIGLVLGMDLARRGVRVTVVEKRSLASPLPPRTNHIAARTMEVFRQLGFADEIRQAGMPSYFAHDVAYRTSLTGPELGRVRIPSPRERNDPAAQGPDVWWPTPEPSHRVNQMFTDPILAKHARRTPGLSIVERTEVRNVIDRGDHVVVIASDADGREATLSARYVVGCDGGHSRVRAMVGASLEGDAYVQRYHAVHFRSRELVSCLGPRPSWQTHFVNERQSGSVMAIDGRSVWIANIPLPPAEDEDAIMDSASLIRTMLGVGPEFELEIESESSWTGRRLISNKFRAGRVFLCGDSAHIWIPFGGFGMNAGIADAMNLSWLLAGSVHGWGGPRLLDAYEAERRSVTLQVSHFAMDTALALQGKRTALSPYLEEASVRGLQARRELGKELVALGSIQYCAGGLNFGYFYDQSPIIEYDGEQAPDYSVADFRQSTVPGCRTPHIWLDGDVSLYDVLGPDFTLIRTDPTLSVSALVDAAAEVSLPLKVLDVRTKNPVYAKGLVLSRPDRHVAWRGDQEPAEARKLIDHVRGALVGD